MLDDRGVIGMKMMIMAKTGKSRKTIGLKEIS